MWCIFTLEVYISSCVSTRSTTRTFADRSHIRRILCTIRNARILKYTSLRVSVLVYAVYLFSFVSGLRLGSIRLAKTKYISKQWVQCICPQGRKLKRNDFQVMEKRNEKSRSLDRKTAFQHFWVGSECEWKIENEIWQLPKANRENCIRIRFAKIGSN